MIKPKKHNVFKILLIALAVIIFLMLVANITLVFFEDKISSNVFTIFSGWVSGFATLAVGIIAAMQSKKYNDSNAKFLEDSLMLEKCKSIVANREKYVENFILLYSDFKKQYKVSIVSNEQDLRRVSHLSTTKEKLTTLIALQIGEFVHWDITFITCIRLDPMKSWQKDLALEAMKKYQQDLKSISKMIDNLDNKDITATKIDEINKISIDYYGKILSALDKYYVFLVENMNQTLFKKYNDYEYLIANYSFKDATIEKDKN